MDKQGSAPPPQDEAARADRLAVDELYLWPSLAGDPRVVSTGRAELVEFYPSRSAVRPDVWSDVIGDARRQLDILVYAGLYLFEGHADLVGTLVRKAQQGIHIRVLLGDPDGSAVALRGAEEGVGDGLAARIGLSRRYLQPASGTPEVRVRMHDATLYNSIIRSDEQMLVNTHVYGAPAAQSPVLRLRKVTGGRVFDHYAASLERVWETAKPTNDR